MNVVELRGIEKRYGRTRALDGVSLDLAPGRLILLRGSNGAGKSTLLRVIAGLARPTRGSVRIEGRDLFRASEAAARGRVCFLGSEPGLYAELTVRENLRFCARLAGSTSARVEACISGMDLTTVAERPLRELSLGYRRRAGLARVLLAEPALALLDEPWNGLDDAARVRLASQLDLLRSAGRGALVAAHDVGAFEALFDQTLEISAGRVLEPSQAPLAPESA